MATYQCANCGGTWVDTHVCPVLMTTTGGPLQSMYWPQPSPPAEPAAAALLQAYEQLERAARLIAELPTPRGRFWVDGMTRIDKALEAVDAVRAAGTEAETR